MKIALLWSYYEPYLKDCYAARPELSSLSYDEQLAAFHADYFGITASYVNWLRHLGHESFHILNNCELLQRRWAEENGFHFDSGWRKSVALEQIKRIRPDILFMGSMFDMYGEFLEQARPYAGRLVGWIACPIPKRIDFSQMDMILTGSQEYAEMFRRHGVKSECMNVGGFDPDILSNLLPNDPQDVDVCFIGGFSHYHTKRLEFLTEIARATKLSIWGYGMEPRGAMGWIRQRFSPTPLERVYKGQAWGLQMYRILRRSKIVLNSHIDVAGKQAGNMRLYETTGVGAFLLTDAQSNIEDLFKCGKEVACYKDADDAVEKIRHYLANDAERRMVAEAGQKRTLTEYNYEIITGKLIGHFKDCLNR